MYMASSWVSPVFFAASECEFSCCNLHFLYLASITVVMILRVYAMWNQSRTILYVLLFIYVPQIIFAAVLAGLNENGISGEFWAIIKSVYVILSKWPYISLHPFLQL